MTIQAPLHRDGIWPMAIGALCCLLIILPTQPAVAQDDGNESRSKDSAEAILADQQRLAEQYRLLEEKLFSLYRYEQDQNPDRSELLKRAFQQSKEKLTLSQLNQVVQMIERQRLREAQQGQAVALKHLEELLAVLQSENRNQRIRDDILRHQEYLEEVERILRIQKGIRGQAQADVDPKRLKNSQDKNTDRTEDLSREIRKNEEENAADNSGDPDDSSGNPAEGQAGKGSDSQGAPQEKNPARQRLDRAAQKMKQAQEKLDQARRDESVQDMTEAEQELAQAKKELEEILRQLREEEIGRTLADLESRFRQMLQVQIKIFEGTQSLDSVPVADRKADFEIQCGKQSVAEKSLAAEAERTLLVLQDDGSSIATTETVIQMQADMDQVAQRLAAARVGEITQDIERDIIESLEYLIEALAQAQENLQDENQPPSSSPNSSPGQQALVDQLAELKLIRGLQERILKRHERYSRQLDDPNDPIGFATDADLRDALLRLRDQQSKLQEITREIVVGGN